MEETDRPLGHSEHAPTYVAQLADGRRIRMSCFCANGLDWGRGDRLVEFVLQYGDRFRGNRSEPIATWFELADGRRVDRPAGEGRPTDG
jgi:hypothetical protein